MPSEVPRRGGKIGKGHITPLSQGPKSGRNCCVAPAFSRVLKRADKVTSGYITRACSGPTNGWNCSVTRTPLPPSPQKRG